MSSNEVQELIFKLRPEGVDETTDALEKQQETMTETGEVTEEQAGVMEKFASKFESAMGVIITGLAVAVAGLATQIPVLGSLFDGLKAVLTSIALVIDEKLRPVIQPVVDAFFDLAKKIDNAPEPVKTLIAAITALVGVGTAVVGALAAIGGIIPLVSSGFAAVAGAVGTVVGVLGGPLIAAVLAVVGAAALLWKAWTENWLGIRDKTAAAADFIMGKLAGFRDFLAGVWNGLTNLLSGEWRSVLSTIITKTAGFVTALIGLALQLLGGLLPTFQELFKRGQKIFQKFGAAVRTAFEIAFASAVSIVKKHANNILRTIESMVNSAISALNRLPQFNLAAGVTVPKFDRRSLDEIASQGAQRLSDRFGRIDSPTSRARPGPGRGQGANRNTFAERIQRTIIVELDGKEIARAVSEEQDKGVSDRGQ